MSIKVQLASDAPQGQENRPKIRVTLDDGQPPLLPSPQAELPMPQGRLSAPQAAKPVPPRVLAFWNFDEDKHRAQTPWRYVESPNEQAVREQAERNGAWTG
jgi:hypothetical protein